MSTVQYIESAISTLSRVDLAALRAWFVAFDSEAWDRQIAEDAQSGRLDSFYQRLQQEDEGQPDIPLDDVLNQKELS
jgi:hypothetical protein